MLGSISALKTYKKPTASEGGSAKFLPVFIGAASNIGENPFIIWIATKLVVVLVPSKPWIVVVSQLNCSLEPGNRLCLFTQQRVNASKPICLITIDNGLWLFAENGWIDLIPLSSRSVQER